jgi:hypothetical protein
MIFCPFLFPSVWQHAGHKAVRASFKWCREQCLMVTPRDISVAGHSGNALPLCNGTQVKIASSLEPAVHLMSITAARRCVVIKWTCASMVKCNLLNHMNLCFGHCCAGCSRCTSIAVIVTGQSSWDIDALRGLMSCSFYFCMTMCHVDSKHVILLSALWWCAFIILSAFLLQFSLGRSRSGMLRGRRLSGLWTATRGESEHRYVQAADVKLASQ